MNNGNFKVYDVIRVYNQEKRLVEINTWVEKRDHARLPDYKRLNSFSLFEHQL